MTKSAGRSAELIMSRNPIFGCTHVTPIGARSSVPSSSTTPWNRPPEVSIDLTRAFVRISAPKDFCRATDRVGHRAHPALLVAPGAEVAVAHVADRVVEHHVRGAGLVRPGPRPDDPVHREHALDRVGLEPIVQQVRDAHREQAGDVTDAADAQLAYLPRRLGGLDEVTDRERAGARRALQEERPEDVGDALQPRLPFDRARPRPSSRTARSSRASARPRRRRP